METISKQNYSAIDVFSYTQVCEYAFKNNLDMQILPEEGKIILHKDSKQIGIFQEIGKCFFVFLENVVA